MSRGIRKYYKYHYREQLDFRYRLYLLDKEKDLSRRIQLAQDLMCRAVHGCGIGMFTSRQIEQPFLDLADTLPCSENIQCKPNSFLHVMTQAYLTGGHTRVVERWIETSPYTQKHSIVLLKQEDISYPQKLVDITQCHDGNLYLFDDTDIVDRAIKLRELALQYEYVILHIHMDDPTAIVAFGTNKFIRPIILFNHADHLYWCGASIVDMLADLRDNHFARKRRGINKAFPIRIPFEPNPIFLNYPKSKEQSRIELGLPLNKKIILTTGSAVKFNPFTKYEFCDILSEVVLKHKDIVCYGIGPVTTTGNWSNYGEQFKALGAINYGEQYFDYLNACDVYMNSIPIGGGTAMLDAVQFHKPVLSYSPFYTKLGDIIKGITTTHNIKKFNIQLELLLTSDVYAHEFSEMQYTEVLNYHGVDAWRKNINQMLALTPKIHNISLQDETLNSSIDDLAVLISLWNNSLSKRRWNIYDTYHVFQMLYRYIKDFFRTQSKR